MKRLDNNIYILVVVRNFLYIELKFFVWIYCEEKMWNLYKFFLLNNLLIEIFLGVKIFYIFVCYYENFSFDVCFFLFIKESYRWYFFFRCFDGYNVIVFVYG